MKFPQHNQSLEIPVANRHPVRQRRGERGFALVITLILLAIITFMAIAFLVVSRSERSSVGTATDHTLAQMAAEAGKEDAIASMVAPMMGFTNRYDFDLGVSTNYINRLGFSSSYGFRDGFKTNVNYEYLVGGGVLSPGDRLQNIANLQLDPRPPVYILNPLTGSNDFRFYLDLNRNRKFEPTGLMVLTNFQNQPIYDGNGQPLFGYVTGDPQYIGGLEFPDRPHSATNRFLYRYAYVVSPAGKTLDVNYIHNYARLLNTAMPAGQDGFLRNMGVGTYEINLASFLVDLNTNYWPYPANNAFGAPYRYEYTDLGTFNRGTAFEDALSVVRYRYGGSMMNQASVRDLLGANGIMAFASDYMDGYSLGPLMLGYYWLGPGQQDTDLNRVTQPWAGAPNLNHFFTVQDLFNPSKTSQAFVDRLNAASSQNSTYDRYTYYRLLSQLGTDSAPDPAERMNLNYDNLVKANNQGVVSSTNFFAWEPNDFFSNATYRLLADAGYNFRNTNIPIYLTNFYTPSVHRLLQVAANLYDATTNTFVPAGTNLLALPSVFRPIFRKDAGNGEVYIVGYVKLVDDSMAYASAPPMVDLKTGINVSLLRTLGTPFNPYVPDSTEPMVSGIPLIVGAKKGWPNFNEFAMQTRVDITRKLQFLKRSGLDKYPYTTNQMLTVTISNVFGVEAWNSYSNAFPRDLQMIAAVDTTATITNQYSQILLSNRMTRGSTPVLMANSWGGYPKTGSAQASFKAPWDVSTNGFLFLTNSTYHHGTRRFIGLSGIFESPSGYPVPQWWLQLHTKVRFILVDTGSRQIVDYVNLDSAEDPLDLAAALSSDGQCGDSYVQDGSPGSMWCTNRGVGVISDAVPTFGVRNQVGVCGGVITRNVQWQQFVNEYPRVSQNAAIDFFRSNVLALPPMYGSRIYPTNECYAPFSPTRSMYISARWQANDPLVHYTIPDLTNLEKTNRVEFVSDNSTIANIGRINERYEPWGGNPISGSASPTKFELTVKDPLVTRSDDWVFPTNKFPNLGWLGRVHRGTPWQTIYLKSPRANLQQWQRWTGNGVQIVNWDGNKKVADDALFSMPNRDRDLLDIFTTVAYKEGSRGRLSVNQKNLAAWSAVLGGVVVITNTVRDADFANDPLLPPKFDGLVIPPAGTHDPTLPPAVVRLVSAINDVRATNRAAAPKQAFQRVGDILEVPELTVGTNTYYVGTYPNGYWAGVSPFLNLGDPSTRSATAADPAARYTYQQKYGINDAAYERIPQQIMGLLQCESEPRFVIYSYGQALKPAPKSVVLSGPYSGICTNYQITAEVATRTVVRIAGSTDKPRVVVESFNVLPPD